MASPRPLKSDHIGGRATACFQKEPGALKFNPQPSLLTGTSASTLGMGCERDRDRGGRPGGPWLNQLREEKGTQERGKAGRTEGGYHEGRKEMPGRSRATEISQLADPRCLTSSKCPSQVTPSDSVCPLAAPGLACDSASLAPPDWPSPGRPRPTVHSADHLASWVLILGQCPFYHVTLAGLRALPQAQTMPAPTGGAHTSTQHHSSGLQPSSLQGEH